MPREEREKACAGIADSLGAGSLADMRALSWEDFAAAGDFDSNPIVDGWVIPEDPMILYAKGKQHKIPLITGTNKDEGTLFLAYSPLKGKRDYLQLIRERYKENADEILSLYPAESDDVNDMLNRLTTDLRMALHARRQVRWMDARGISSYLYQFTRIPPTRAGRMLKAFHGAEISYVFGNIGPDWGQAEAIDRQLSDAMMTYWTRFAASGDPNSDGLPVWPVYLRDSDAHLELGVKIQTGQHLREKELDMLDRHHVGSETASSPRKHFHEADD